MQTICFQRGKGHTIHRSIHLTVGIEATQLPVAQSQGQGSSPKKVLLVGGMMATESLRTTFNLGDRSRPTQGKFLTNHQALSKRDFVIPNRQTFQPVHIFQEKMSRIIIISFMYHLGKRFPRIFFRYKSHLKPIIKMISITQGVVKRFS